MASANRTRANRNVLNEIGVYLDSLPDDYPGLITSVYICNLVNKKTRSRRFDHQRAAALLRQREDLKRVIGGWVKVKCNV
jgi:hypothetical protein